MNIQALEKTIKSKGYKITSQRRAILQVLIGYQSSFISAEKMYNEAKSIHPKTNLSTIYRNLEILDNINLVHKVQTKDGNSLYGLVCTDAHHHHIICKGCGKTEIIDFCPLENLKNLSKNKKFTLTDHKIELYGYCEKCNDTDTE